MNSAPAWVIRGLTEDDWEALRRLRLMALEDAPAAFETTLADALTWNEQRWRDRARGSSTTRLFFAHRGGQPVGMAGIYAEEDGSAQVISVWVRPDQRRQGAARALLATAVEFALAVGLSPVVIWVADGNAAAQRLYESVGFRGSGHHKQVGSSSVDEHEMVWSGVPPVAFHQGG